MRLCRLCKRLFPGDQTVCPDDATSTVETALEPLPSVLLARFPKCSPLALGATGTLYLVDQPETMTIEAQVGPQLVLKVLAQELTRDPAERARHRRDLRKQTGLVHPQLPRLLEEGEAEGRVWFTREYVPAISLAVRLHKHGAFQPEAALSIIVQLAAALDGLHQLGLVHGDLKPGHVLLRAAQSGSQDRISLQLIDATFAAPLTADNPARRGTADYAAKEIVEGTVGTFRSDLYALGCLSHELFTGVPPFRGESLTAPDGQTDTTRTLAAQRNAEPKQLPDNVPQAVRSAITSMLSKDARRRPFSAQQVRRSIEPLLAPAKPAAPRGSRSVLQREAAALRLTGPTAKPVAPRKNPDATVELDVEDLEEAIQANDAEQELNEARAPGATVATKASAAIDDSAPSLVSQPSAAARSQVTTTHVADKSTTIPSASAGGVPTQGSAAAAPSADLAKAAPPRAASSGEQAASELRARSAVDTAAEPADEPPRRTRTGTKFGLGPVRTSDIEAAALAAELHAGAAGAEPADHQAQSATRSAYPAVRESQPAVAHSSAAPVTVSSARRKRYSTSSKALTESPRLLLWAAGGLVVLITLIRLAFGPAEPMRSPSVVVHVPEVAEVVTDVSAPSVAAIEVSELALIGGDIGRMNSAPLPAAAREQPLQPDSQPTASAQAVDQPDDDPEASAGNKSVRTVSAVSVKGGLARAASNRAPAASSGTPVADNPASVDPKAQGRELYKAGKFRDAADAYQRATQRNASDAAAFAGLGGSLLATGDTRKAIAAYQRAVSLEPAVSGFQAALGRAYLKKGDRTRARAAYSKALKLDPNNQAARSGMANAKTR